MNVLIQLLNNKEVSQQVKKKILQLVQHWGLRFEDDNDVLPLFYNVYSALKQRSLPFPNEDEARKQVNKLKDSLEGKAPMPDSKPLDKKHARLKKDLEVVIENVVLTNEMIDAHDPDDEVDDNDALVSLVQSLKTFENKLMELIEKIKNDEIMNLALLTNDDMQKTMKRYKRLEHGRVPENFKPECRKYLPGYKEESETNKSKPAKKPESGKQKYKPVEKPQEPVNKPKQQEEDIFGFNEPSEPQPSNTSQAKPDPPQKQSSGNDDLFGVDFGDSGSNTQPSQEAVSSNISKLNEIMERMSLESQQNSSAQFNTAAPSMGPGMGGQNMGGPGGPGMGGPGMGGPMGGPGMSGPGMGAQNPGMGYGGGGFGPSPGMFNTGMPQNYMYGGGMGGNMNPGYNPQMGYNPPGGFNNQDPFSQPQNSIFATAPSYNYNPGGGPEAFKERKKEKKVEKGPKEFNDLFGMASKISDRTQQPTNMVDDYVTSYKNNLNDMGNSNFDMGGGQNNDQNINDFFGGGDGFQQMPAQNPSGNMPDNSNQNNDPFGEINNMYGGGNDFPQQQNQPQPPTDDLFGGGNAYNQPEPSNQYDPFSAAQPDEGASQEPMFDAFGGSNAPVNNQQPGGQLGGEKSKQDELFDIFG